MDKTLFQNEDILPEESHQLGTDHSVVVKTKAIDVLSLPQKSSVLGSAKDKKNRAPDEQPLDEDWLLLSQDWQSQPYEKTDIQALLKRTKRRTLWAKSLLALDAVATVGLIIAFIVGLYRGSWGNVTIAYLGFGGLLSAVFVYYEVKIRQQTWQHNCDSPDKAVVNAIAGCRSSIKYVLLIKYSMWLVLPLVNAYSFSMSSESLKSPWPSLIAINTFVLVTWLISHFFHVKRNKELKQLMILAEE